MRADVIVMRRDECLVDARKREHSTLRECCSLGSYIYGTGEDLAKNLNCTCWIRSPCSRSRKLCHVVQFSLPTKMMTLECLTNSLLNVWHFSRIWLQLGNSDCHGTPPSLSDTKSCLIGILSCVRTRSLAPILSSWSLRDGLVLSWTCPYFGCKVLNVGYTHRHVKGALRGPEGLTRYSRSILLSPSRTRSSAKDSHRESMSLSCVHQRGSRRWRKLAMGSSASPRTPASVSCCTFWRKF